MVPGSHQNHFLVEFSQGMIPGGLEGKKIREASMCLPLALAGVIVVAIVLVTKSCPTLCDPMDYSPPGSSVHSILEWEAIPYSRGSSRPRDRTQVSCIIGTFFTISATRENS